MADVATLSVAVGTADLERANKSLETFANRASKAEGEAKDLGREAVKSSRAIAVANDNAAQSVARVSKAFSVARGALAGFGVALAGVSFASFLTASSDLAETVSKTTTLFGSASAEMLAFGEQAAQSMGLSQQAALEAAGTMGNMFLQLGATADEAGRNSRAMVQLSADLASFHNVSGGAAAVSAAMQSAFRGEYDALQRYIPTINAAAVEMEALAQTGKTSAKELTALEKATAVQAIVMRDAGAAVGDFARTSAGMANQQRIAAANAQNLTAKLGDFARPAATAGLVAINTALGFLTDNLDTVVKGAGVAGAALLAAFSPAILAGMASGITAIATAGVAAMTAIKVAVMANPLGALAVAIATILSAVYLFRDEIAKVFGIDLVSEVDKAKAGFKSLEEQILRTAGVARTGLVDVAMGRSEAAQLEIVELRRQREQLEAAIAKRRELRPMDALPAGMTRRAAELDQQIRAAEARLERAEADLSRAITRAQTKPAVAVEPAAGGVAGGAAVDRQEASLADRIREANRQRLVRGYGRAVEAAMQPVQSRGVDFSGMLQGARNLIGQGMDAVSEAFERNSRAYAEAIDVVRREARGVFDTFTNALQRGARLWDAFKQAGLDAINSILRRIIDAQFDRIFANIFQPNASGGAGNILSAVASFFGGARANGGPVPGASGTVIPNHALGGAMKIELVLAEDREAFTRVVDARVLQGVGASVTLSRAQAQNDGRKAALYRRA